MGSICLHSAAIPEDFNNTMFREDEHSHAKSDIPSQEPTVTQLQTLWNSQKDRGIILAFQPSASFLIEMCPMGQAV